MKGFAVMVAFFITIILGATVGLAVKLIWFPVNTVNQSVDMAYGVVNETLDADNAIYNYEWFKQQEADIERCLNAERVAEDEYDAFVAALSAGRSQWEGFDKKEEASLRNSVTACKKITDKAIQDYNARAAMVNRAVFKDNLPTNISRALFVGGKLTNQ
jgi:hypothetical protein